MKHLRGQAGFTLIELLVALALMALMVAFALGALRSLKSIGRVAQVMDGADDVEAASRHLRHIIADARIVFAPENDNSARIIFEGGEHHLRFVSVLNDALEHGGLYILDYGFDPSDKTFVLHRQVLRPGKAMTGGDGLLLLADVAGITFRYCDGPSCTAVPAEWPTVWEARDRLPRLVAVSVEFPPGDVRKWPLLVAPIAAAQ